MALPLGVAGMVPSSSFTVPVTVSVVGEVVVTTGGDEIARHRRSYETADFVFDPLHYLPLLEQKVGALDQAAKEVQELEAVSES